MDNIQLLDDERSRIIAKECDDKLKMKCDFDLSPSYIGEKIQLWFAEIDRSQQRYNRLDDYAILLREYNSQVRKNDEVLEEVVDGIIASEGSKFPDRVYFRILRFAVVLTPAVPSPIDFLKRLGFVDPVRALAILSMKESDEAINLYAGLESTFDPSDKKQKYLFMLAFYHYRLLGGEVGIQMRKDFNSIIYRLRTFKDIVSKYKGDYDIWKSINCSSFEEILKKKSDLLGRSVDLDQLFERAPYACVELIFLRYYLTYENYDFFFACFSRLVRISKLKKIMKLASYNCEYRDDIYKEYVRYCEQSGDKPAFQFGNLSYISEEMFNRAPKETGYPYLDLGLSYENIKGLYDNLLNRGWIKQHTSFELFVFYFSGKCKPVDLSPIQWTTRVNELAYLLTILYKEKISSEVPFKIVRKIFFVEGQTIDEKKNLSSIASGLGRTRKRVVNELYNTVFCQNVPNKIPV